jgi:hypothetical protein
MVSRLKVGVPPAEQTRVQKNTSICSILLFFRQVIIQNLTVLNEFTLVNDRSKVGALVWDHARAHFWSANNICKPENGCSPAGGTRQR